MFQFFVSLKSSVKTNTKETEAVTKVTAVIQFEPNFRVFHFFTFHSLSIYDLNFQQKI
jgi:hypothetical protein